MWLQVGETLTSLLPQPMSLRQSLTLYTQMHFIWPALCAQKQQHLCKRYPHFSSGPSENSILHKNTLPSWLDTCCKQKNTLLSLNLRKPLASVRPSHAVTARILAETKERELHWHREKRCGTVKGLGQPFGRQLAVFCAYCCRAPLWKVLPIRGSRVSSCIKWLKSACPCYQGCETPASP